MLLIVVLLFSMSYMNAGMASPKTSVAVEPKDNTGAVGTTFTVNITVTEVVELYGWEFQLNYNPNILNVTKVVQGPFLKAINKTLFVHKINNTAGIVNALATFEPPYPPHGASGSGILASITFEVKGEGTTTLDLDTSEPYRGLRTVIGASPTPIAHEEVDGSFSNKAELPLQLILAGVVVVVIVGVVAFFFWRRKKTTQP
jgi:hypothetical protein